MSIYYISSGGNDGSNGLSPESPWKTLGCIKRFVKGGDTVRLKCGDVFFGRIELPPGTGKNRTVIESYGEGEKPQVTRYKIAGSPEIWECAGKNIWRADMAKCRGDKSSDGSNVGFIQINGKNHGFKKFALTDLKKQWDFYSLPEGLYVYSDKNPCEYSEHIYIAAAGSAVMLGDNTEISGIDIYGGGSHGITGSVKNAKITDCRIHDFGGAHLVTDKRPNIRFGNGIELWSDAQDILIQNCKIYNIYDVAFTMQGFPEKGGWKNVVFRNNILWNNQQSFEIWTQDENPGSGMKDCVFENNLCLNAGYCWSYPSRPDKMNAVHLLMYALNCEYHDITIKNNTFYNPRKSLYYSASGKIPKDYKSDNNVIFLREGQGIINGKYCLKEQFAEIYKKEINSEFYIIK